MKLSRSIVVAFVVVSSVASAAMAESTGTWTGYLVRTDTPGFVMPGTGVWQRCTITPDEVIVTTRLEGVRTTERRPLDVDGDFGALIAAAAKGEMTSTTAPADIPLRIYAAVELQDGSDHLRVDLGSRTDGLFTHNAAPEAMGLKHFIDTLCPANGN